MAKSSAQWVWCKFASGLQAWRIRVDCASGLSDWPIQYDNGTVAYDYPERVPAYIKRQVIRMYRIGPPEGTGE